MSKKAIRLLGRLNFMVLLGLALAPAGTAGAGSAFDGTYKGSYLVVRGFYNPSLGAEGKGQSTDCLNNDDATVIIKNNHFDIPWADITLSVDIAGDGTFRSWGHFVSGTHPPLVVSIHGRILGENLEADVNGHGSACAAHLSLKKS